MTIAPIRWKVANRSDLFARGRPRTKIQAPDSPGVYRIRVRAENGRFMRIPRLAAVDDAGILHIGKSIHLKTRIQAFFNAAQGGAAAHKAGIEYCRWPFGDVAPFHLLVCEYNETGTEEAALALERKLHVSYRKKYLDRPPLDGTSGRRS